MIQSIEQPTETRDDAPTLCLAGAAPDTGNLGVTALCYSVVSALRARVPEARVVVLDHGRGLRDAQLLMDEPSDGQLAYQRMGAVNSRRFHRPENLWNMRVRNWVRPRRQQRLGEVSGIDAVLDLSAGDSFTDMYGARRFQTVMLPKRIALENGLPLVLLPQTYGPFRSDRVREQARQVTAAAAMAWARDPRSYESLSRLLGESFDPARHREGVDVAFLLAPQPPSDAVRKPFEQWLAESDGPVVGFNVSGLLYNDAEAATQRYRLRADYREVVHRFMGKLLAETDCRIALTPHVVTPLGHAESDIDACAAAARHVAAADERLKVLPVLDDPRQVKWLIGRCDWFCGTRMHSTIAALSSGVPAAAMAYSIKTAGVFESCGLHEHVADLRHRSTGETAAHLWHSWLRRDAARSWLRRRLPDVQARATWQIDAVLQACLGIEQTSTT
jgi:polysaccharide pyruvyl transferase WcaK-like protein